MAGISAHRLVQRIRIALRRTSYRSQRLLRQTPAFLRDHVGFVVASAAALFIVGVLFVVSNFVSETVSSSRACNGRVSIYLPVTDHPTPYGIASFVIGQRLVGNGEGGMEVTYRSVRGSIDTIMQITEDGCAIGLIQEDVLNHYYEGDHPYFPLPAEEQTIYAIGRVFPENIRFLTNSDTTLNIHQARIHCLPEPGTGMRVTAYNVFRTLHPAVERREDCWEKPPDGGLRVEVYGDPMGASAAPGTGLIEATLSEIDAQLIERAYPGIYATPVSSADASGAPRLSVSSVLVVGAEIDNPTVTRLLDILGELEERANLFRVVDTGSLLLSAPRVINPLEHIVDTQCRGWPGEFRDTVPPEAALALIAETYNSAHLYRCTQYLEFGHRLDEAALFGRFWGRAREGVGNIASSVGRFVLGGEASADTGAAEGDRYLSAYQDISAPLHLAIRAALLDPTSASVVHAFNSTTMRVLALFALIVNIMFLFVNHRRKFSVAGVDYEWPKRKIAVGAGIIGVFLVYNFFFSLLIWVSEFNEGIASSDSMALESVMAAVRFGWAYITTGESRYELHSELSLLWYGALEAGNALIAFSLTAGVFAQAFNFTVRFTMHPSVLIVGNSTSTAQVLKELRQTDHRYAQINHSLDEIERAEPLEKYAIASTPGTDLTISVNEAIVKAKAVIILSDNKLAENREVNTDYWTLLQVRAFREEIAHGEKRCIAEVQDPRSVSLIRSANGHVGADEVICVAQFGAELLVQAVDKEEIVEIFTQLARTTDNSDEIYFDRVRQSGLVFGDIDDAFLEANGASGSRPRIPIGIRFKEGGMELNPAKTQNLSPGDDVIVIAKFKSRRARSGADADNGNVTA